MSKFGFMLQNLDLNVTEAALCWGETIQKGGREEEQEILMRKGKGKKEMQYFELFEHLGVVLSSKPTGCSQVSVDGCTYQLRWRFTC